MRLTRSIATVSHVYVFVNRMFAVASFVLDSSSLSTANPSIPSARGTRVSTVCETYPTGSLANSSHCSRMSTLASVIALRPPFDDRARHSTIQEGLMSPQRFESPLGFIFVFFLVFVEAVLIVGVFIYTCRSATRPRETVSGWRHRYQCLVLLVSIEPP